MKRFYRSKRDRKLAGVCGGLGEYFGVDPNLVRLLAVLIALSTGVIPVLITYLVAWWILPEEDEVEGA
ncbi:TPA: PspC domain-containing protein [Candidatus Bipolaricaulota bacterium]|nr:PspC domain-containing protein [Candidatus Bipolaricaulota bacterium]